MSISVLCWSHERLFWHGDRNYDLPDITVPREAVWGVRCMPERYLILYGSETRLWEKRQGRWVQAALPAHFDREGSLLYDPPRERMRMIFRDQIFPGVSEEEPSIPYPPLASGDRITVDKDGTLVVAGVRKRKGWSLVDEEVVLWRWRGERWEESPVIPASWWQNVRTSAIFGVGEVIDISTEGESTVLATECEEHPEFASATAVYVQRRDGRYDILGLDQPFEGLGRTVSGQPTLATSDGELRVYDGEQWRISGFAASLSAYFAAQGDSLVRWMYTKQSGSTIAALAFDSNAFGQGLGQVLRYDGTCWSTVYQPRPKEGILLRSLFVE